MEIVAGILMIVIGVIFMFLFALKYQNELEDKNTTPEMFKKFINNSLPILIFWICITGAGIIITIISILERVSLSNPL